VQGQDLAGKIIIMITINPKEISLPKMHGYLLGSVTPRPIALASTMDKDGNVNLSPFSFFNCFGYNPPLVIFSPARRGRDNTTKHTYENVLEVPEVVIHIVSHDMVQQVSLASTEYPKGVNEFSKAGLHAAPSVMVKPPRVVESPVAMECKVTQILPTGNEGGAGILVLCEILLMHISEKIVDEHGKIDPYKLDAVARLGGDYYARVQGESIFAVPKPLDRLGMGIDNLPESIRKSKVLTGNDLGMLANVEVIPVKGELSVDERKIVNRGEEAIHRLVQMYLNENRIMEAWNVLVSSSGL
jgi:flavin reductase (DIM6/NTAB) family NADH-FMN oxidoreductase RutF